MGSDRPPGRRRVLVAGLVAGLLAGAALGVSLWSGAAPAPQGPRPVVLHAAPALVTAGSAVDLSASTYCEVPAAPTCRVVAAEVLVQPSGATGWTSVVGAHEAGVLRFHVAPELVPPEGFAYWIRLRTQDGSTVSYPPGGKDSPIRVVTAADLPVASLPVFRWTDRADAVSTALRLPIGQDDGQVGLSGSGTDAGVQGPSAFDVATDGTIVVADWVNGRAERFSPDGSFRDELPLPARAPVDLAVGRDRLFLTTLGVDAEAFEIATDGRVIGRYPVGYGVASRVAAGVVPRVRVGAGQWVPMRLRPGVPMTPEAQGRDQTATVPLADGSVALSEDTADGFAVVWTRSDGSRGGALLGLPDGVRPGADYFVRPLGDGGALVARGLWDETHFGVAVIRLDAAGRVASFTLLPEPSHRIVAPYSTVRSVASRAVLMVVDDGEGFRIDRFRVR